MALEAADTLEILQLAARYNHAIDYGDPEAWAGTFAEDGVFNAGPETVTGHEALAKFAAGFMSGAQHWTNNHIVEGDGEQATHTCYLNLIRTSTGANSVITGRYNDSLKKIDGQWRFTERTVSPDAKD
jgi:hypothetical protein